MICVHAATVGQASQKKSHPQVQRSDELGMGTQPEPDPYQ